MNIIEIITLMSLVQQLLANVPQEQKKAYESYLHVHLKLLMTSINKAKVQDLTQVLIRKNKCIESCYSSNLLQIQADSILDTVDQIRECKQRCGEEKKAVKKYLDDINYYSSLKMERCSKDCNTKTDEIEFNNCMWGCYNKLDRRYKKYWVEQRQKVQNAFVG